MTEASADVRLRLGVCPICGDERWADSFEPRIAMGSSPRSWVHRCAACGTGVTHFTEVVTDDLIYGDDYYAYSEDNYSTWRQQAKVELYRASDAPWIRHLLQRTTTLIPPTKKGRVLDVGCSVGTFLDQMKALGWETFGTEISRKAAAIARDKSHAVLAPLELHLLPADHFDWITLNNVLEHVEDPRAVLDSLRRVLKSGGTLSIVVPNFDCEDAHLFREFWQCLEVPHHRFHFTELGLRRVLADSGFRTFAVNYVPRYAYSSSFRNARRNPPRETLVSMLAKVAWLQVRKTIHFLSAATIDARYGVFMAAHAQKNHV